MDDTDPSAGPMFLDFEQHNAERPSEQLPERDSLANASGGPFNALESWAEPRGKSALPGWETPIPPQLPGPTFNKYPDEEHRLNTYGVEDNRPDNTTHQNYRLSSIGDHQNHLYTQSLPQLSTSSWPQNLSSGLERPAIGAAPTQAQSENPTSSTHHNLDSLDNVLESLPSEWLNINPRCLPPPFGDIQMPFGLSVDESLDWVDQNAVAPQPRSFQNSNMNL